ncbi:MAG: hypothetical protein V4559_15300 [Pseudomonadota bacterium]
MTDHAMAFYGNRPSRLPNEEERRVLIRRAATWTLVALVHVLLLSAFILDQYQREHVTIRKQHEIILDLTRLPRGAAPPIQMIQPTVPHANEPKITTAPVIVIPPPNPDLAMPQTPADILKAIGEALSCGAENYENLTQAERARCKREPWIARKMPDGTIVLQAANPVSPYAPPVVPKISGADAMRHQMQTTPACNIMLNVPCVQNTPMVGIGIPTN